MKAYKLNRTLYGHTSDVKGLSATKNNGFVSVSRDLSAKLWNTENNEYIEACDIKSHKKYVNSVAVIYTIDGFPDGLIITGSNDQSICIYDIQSNSTIAQLTEHTGAVCTLSCGTNNYLYSGSFDYSMKIWNLNDLAKANFTLKSLYTVRGHEHTVWSVLAIPNTEFCLTGSADKVIKQWRFDQPVHTYRGHSDCVRGLAQNPSNPNYFFSCSNDGTVIQWQLNNPHPLKRYNITSSFLYSICVLNVPTDEKDACYFATSGEDRSLRINHSAKGDSPIQTIYLACQSLWNCICLENSDIVVACSDGTVRVFTKDESRVASKSELDEYEQELSKFAIPTKTDESMAKINRNDLPSMEALAVPGKKDGQIIMINNENEAEVYSWNQAEQRWVKIGVAVGSATAAGGSSSLREKTVYEGKEYDFVFDIQLDDDGKTLKLPYNLSQDPWFAAQEFIHKNELNQIFLDQIAQFIITNTKGETITAQGSTYVDPFTGGARYTPGQSSNNTQSNGSTFYDPFTGEGRYVPSSGTTNNAAGSSAMAVDPFTGASAYHSSASTTPKTRAAQTCEKNEYYPQESFVLFDQKNISTILNKIKEFQAKNNTSEEAIELIEKLSSLDSKQDLKRQIELLLNLLNEWSTDTVFPILDLIRIIVQDSNLQNFLCANNYESVLFESLDLVMNSQSIVNIMLVTRIMCNLFTAYDNQYNEIPILLMDKQNNFINKLTNHVKNTNKAFQLSFTTLLLNYSVLLNKLSLKNNLNKLNEDQIDKIKIDLLHYISGEVNSFIKWDLEAQFRLLVTIGTLITNNAYLTTVAKTIVDLKQYLKKLKDESSLDKVNGCLMHLMTNLSIN